MTSTRHQTALRYISAFKTLSIPTFLALKTPGCMHSFRPGSLSISSEAPRDNASFAAHLTGLKAVVEAFPVTVREIFEDDAQNKVVVWATGVPKFYDEVIDEPLGDWVYEGEYVFMLSMEEGGGRIERVVEFLDSKGTERLLGLVKRAKANKAGIDGK